jgi:MFS family permease
MAAGSNELKPPIYASLALAFASFGDAFLYPFLPLNYSAVGVPIAWIGILLSINRFVRILSNARIVRLLEKYGLRTVTIIAVAFAIVSTAGYAIASGVVVWAIFRVIWGLSFSAMRISTLGYALHTSKQGFALGLTKGIQEAGPLMSLILASFILKYLETTSVFLLLTLLSLPALYFAWRLPRLDNKLTSIGSKVRLRFPSLINSITFVSSFLIDGVIVVVLGVLFVNPKGNIPLTSAAALAALYLGYRRLCLVALSPAGGRLADKIGIGKLFNISLAGVIIGLSVIASGRIEIGVILLFTFYSINVSITPGNISSWQNTRLSAVAENATWRDIGAAVGTLAGGFILASDYQKPVIVFAIFSLALLFCFHLGATNKFFYLWK